MSVLGPIGVFDSGVGGLSVLKQFVRFLPFEDYIYLGDTARVPYGNKSVNTVKQYAIECTNFLLEKKVKLIVIACNTVSAVAIDVVKNISNNVPVVAMIQPAANAAIRSTRNNKIGIIGTRATISSNAYNNAIKKIAGEDVSIFSQDCPLFVPLVEEGMLQHQATKLIAVDYLTKLISEKIDTLVLGCTHYPLLKNLLFETMPNVTQIDTGEHAAITALRLLAEEKLLKKEPPELLTKYNIKFYVTDVPTHFYEQAQHFLGFAVDEPELISI